MGASLAEATGGAILPVPTPLVALVGWWGVACCGSCQGTVLCRTFGET